MREFVQQNRIRATSFTIAFIANLVFATPSFASIYAGSNTGWLVIGSSSYQNEAIKLANRYSPNFPSTVVFRSTNGYFAVTLGWINKNQGNAYKTHLISRGEIPTDSYIHTGERWSQAVWSPNYAENLNRRGFLSATRLRPPGGGAAPVIRDNSNFPITRLSPSQGFVSGLKNRSDSFLSLRKGPGTSYSEIVRMRLNTPLIVDAKSKRWFRVKLTNGMQGWAHSKYVRLNPVPLVGPERTAENTVQVPTIGPDNPTKSKADNPVIAEKPIEKKEPEKIASTPTPEVEKNQPGKEKRVALVLGNSAYEFTTALPNPKNDAAKISASLEKLGFNVITGLDKTKSGMESAVRDFVRALPGADVALFFYAGHAMQVSGQNYLIPVNAKLEDSTAIDFETINLNVILSFMSATDRTSIALLDACRNNPLARNFTRSLGKTRSAFVGRGLAAPTGGDGQMLIGFATAPGEVALDGEGENSPFTNALLKHMETPGVEVELMLKKVKADVYDTTDGSQSPWVRSALRSEFYFAR